MSAILPMSVPPPAEAAANGASLLDDARPGWAESIDLSKLATVRKDWCVLGQLYGTYEAGALALGLDSQGCVNIGVDLPNRQGTFAQFAALDVAWTDEVRKRLN